ncbi:hypothetical protein EOA33_06830 [Mesorhizobium sp. M4A.F.Ca.ET.050.02.1.1]|uniref:hypothetical protein n=1 Tax=Mesorhizobium sp. M4A.F.Ca.ET.050.02.1.1 TaxID=2496754 RepID=UPI000FCC84EE|nr:hypothetical protein [Mesorhizobium sp. M4A.F.Ca.ET.050.02.1.1]RUX51279.1 hypothetical protein EOA33_06830 [Mesorhizobium sp. M4A.F.Ca.ET.050.02.1.1]
MSIVVMLGVNEAARVFARVAAAAHRHMTSAFPVGALRAAAARTLSRLRSVGFVKVGDSLRRIPIAVRDATILVFDKVAELDSARLPEARLVPAIIPPADRPGCQWVSSVHAAAARQRQCF